MKTAISLPDETFQRVDERARQLGISRSELFRRSAERWLSDLDAGALTAEIDAVLSDVGEGENDEILRSAARRTFRDSPE